MCFLQKSEFKDYMMNYRVLQPDDLTANAKAVDFVAFATVDGKPVYCFATFSVNAGTPEEYDEIIRELMACGDKKIRVTLKFKKDKIRDFRIKARSIADVYQDERLSRLELLGWGLHDSWPA